MRRRGIGAVAGFLALAMVALGGTAIGAVLNGRRLPPA
jgi:hypothetical protein